MYKGYTIVAEARMIDTSGADLFSYNHLSLGLHAQDCLVEKVSCESNPRNPRKIHVCPASDDSL